MGGRIAIEMGLMEPERIRSLGLLCPAVAWVKRGFHPLVRLLRPEFGLLPHGFSRNTVASQFWSLFYDRDLIDPEVGGLMVDEFRRIYHSAGARLAFLASARNIYLEAPYGRNGFYPRLADLRPPALFIWGSHDGLVPAAFGRHVAQVAAQRRAGDDRRLRPRSPGGAARGDERPAHALLRPQRDRGRRDAHPDARRAAAGHGRRAA